MTFGRALEEADADNLTVEDVLDVLGAGLLDLLALDNTVANNALTEYFKVVPIPFAADELQYLRRITARNALRALFERP